MFVLCSTTTFWPLVFCGRQLAEATAEERYLIVVDAAAEVIGSGRRWPPPYWTVVQGKQ